MTQLDIEVTTKLEELTSLVKHTGVEASVPILRRVADERSGRDGTSPVDGINVAADALSKTTAPNCGGVSTACS